MRTASRQLRSYSWAVLLFVATVVAAVGHEFAAAITLALIVVKNFWIVWQSQRRATAASSTFWQWLMPVSRAAPRAGRSLLGHTIAGSLHGLLPSALLGETVVLITSAQANFTVVTTAFYAAALLVALVSAGLAAETSIHIKFAPAKWLARTHHQVYRLAVGDSIALVLLLCVSLIGTAAFHAPAAVSIVQIVVFTCVVQVALRLCLGWQEHAGQLATFRQQIGFGLATALLTYGNFVFFFVRHQLSLRGLSPLGPTYGQASAIALATLFACQAAQLWIAYRRPLLREAGFRRILFVGAGGAVLLLLIVIYLPWTHGYFSTASLGIADWATVIAATSLYCASWLAWRYLSQHSRQAVLQLHRSVNR